MSKVDQNYMRKDRDGSLDGRLNMSNHRVSGLADPTDADDAVTRRYVASRFQALSDEVQGNKRKLGALQNLLAVVNNQVLIRKCEITGLDFEYVGDNLFRKYPCTRDDINELRFIDILPLKEYFIHLFEKPADTVTWLNIKEPGTYTIHFDLISNNLISNPFSFELHTRDEIIHFFEHNPKHDINLEKGENCILSIKEIPEFITTGSKIYVYYNI